MIEDLFGSLRAEMERMVTAPRHFIADESFVVVEAKGDNVTKSGKPYRNTYCMIYRVDNGKVREVTEYMDTALTSATLNAPKFPPKPLDATTGGATATTEGSAMPASDSKRLLQHIFRELANGNSRPYVEAMADDFSWIAQGSTPWSGVYAGKKAVIEELFASLRHEMEGRIKTIPRRIIADGGTVVVEARGDNMTKAGKPYRNTYCMVFRVTDGKLTECVEHMDTDLVTKVLAAPKHPPKPLPSRT